MQFAKLAIAAVVVLVPVSVLKAEDSGTKLSPAQQRIAWAEKAIGGSPETAQPYNQLAMALAERGRETSDAGYYSKAEQALEHSFRIAPLNFEGRKIKAWILLGKHEFALAKDLAVELNKQVPDDLQVYGFLADANAELGNYEEAEAATQWMLDLRPGSISAFTRAAYLRELFGLYPGAVELMNAAYQRTPSREVENRAWILTHLAHLETLGENLDSAERLVAQALQLFPDYHYALGQLAQIRIAQGKYDQAVETHQRRFDSAPHPENLYALADALKRAQRLEEAEDAFRKFELLARKEIDNADNANRELIFFYADHANNPAEALRIAHLEFDRRKDVYTRDAYAWALFVNGRSLEARMHIQEALAVGVRDPKVLAHAAVIAPHATQ